jgi:hypothetical protein
MLKKHCPTKMSSRLSWKEKEHDLELFYYSRKDSAQGLQVFRVTDEEMKRKDRSASPLPCIPDDIFIAHNRHSNEIGIP